MFNWKAIAGNSLIGGAVVAVVTFGIFKIQALSNKVNKIVKAIDDISDDVDLTVPEHIVKLAMGKAAEKACKAAAERAVSDISDDIHKKVNDTIIKSYRDVEADVKSKLEEKINMTTLDRIEKLVVDDVSKKVIKNVMSNSIFSRKEETDVSSVIRECKAAGMSSYDIQKVLDRMFNKDIF